MSILPNTHQTFIDTVARRRAYALFLIILIANLLFTVEDLLHPPVQPGLVLFLKLIQVVVVLGLCWWLHHRHDADQAGTAMTIAITLGAAMTAASGIVTSESLTTLTLCSLAAIATPVLLPPGVRRQLYVLALLFVGVACNLGLAGSRGAELGYMIASFALALSMAVYLAIDLDRYQREAAGDREALARSAELFDAMARQAQAYQFIVGNDGKLRYISPSIEQVLGLRPTELIGTTAFDLMHPDDLAQIAGTLQTRAMRSGPLPPLIYRMRHADGSWHHIEVRINNMFDDPIIDGLLGSAHDVTERVRAQQLLAESRQFLQATLDSLAAHIAILDESGKILATNRAWQSFATTCGTPQTGTIGSNYLAVCDAAVGEEAAGAHAVACGIREVIVGQRASFEFEYPCHSPTEQAWYAMQVTPFLAPGALRVVVSHEEITERKRAEQSISAARDHAVELARRRSEFVAAMSHEVRTPLNGVLGMTNLLLDTGLNPQQREFAEHVRAAGESMLSIVNEILDFSKVEAGKIDLESILFSTEATVRAAMAVVADTARRKGLELKSSVASDVPAELLGDSNRLRQILTNLLGNAVKFTEQGGVSVSVSCDARENDIVLMRFEVADTGIGIDPQSSERIFDAFAQGFASTARRFGGTGLGLTISKQLVELLGGEIGVHQQPDGSTFWFTARFAVGPSDAAIPSPVIQDAATTAPQPKLDAAAPGSPNPSPLLLVVEDNEINQKVAVHMLRKLGYRSDVAASGAQAIEMATSERYAAILMDCQMPQMDGFEATAQIRARGVGRHVPIIAMTANAILGDRERCLAAGMDDYIAKPVSTDAFARVLQKWIVTPPPAATSAPAAPPQRSDKDDLLARFGGDQALLQDIGRLFLTEGPQLIATIATALERGDRTEVARGAHTLKGAASNFGAIAKVAVVAAQRLEFLATSNARLDACAQTLATLHQEIDHVCERLRRVTRRA